MFQVRFHGRGGQGVVTAAEVLSVAAFIDGKEAQAFPSFGSERMGAPVTAFCRISDSPIRLREPVTTPDVIVIQDATLLGSDPALFVGLPFDGRALLNATPSTPVRADVSSRVAPGHLHLVPASDIALRHVGRPLPNAPLLGALAAITGIVRAASLRMALQRRFPGRAGEQNADAADEAFFRALAPATAGGW